MPTNKKEQWEALLGGVDEIVSLLSIEALPPEDQMKVIEKFSSIVFKRVLLRIPEAFAEELKAIIASGENIDDMTVVRDLLLRAFPDLNAVVREEMTQVETLFRNAK